MIGNFFSGKLWRSHESIGANSKVWEEKRFSFYRFPKENLLLFVLNQQFLVHTVKGSGLQLGACLLGIKYVFLNEISFSKTGEIAIQLEQEIAKGNEGLIVI